MGYYQSALITPGQSPNSLHHALHPRAPGMIKQWLLSRLPCPATHHPPVLLQTTSKLPPPGNCEPSTSKGQSSEDLVRKGLCDRTRSSFCYPAHIPLAKFHPRTHQTARGAAMVVSLETRKGGRSAGEQPQSCHLGGRQFLVSTASCLTSSYVEVLGMQKFIGLSNI